LPEKTYPKISQDDFVIFIYINIYIYMIFILLMEEIPHQSILVIGFSTSQLVQDIFTVGKVVVES